MRRLGQRLFAASCAASTLLLAITVALWVRSEWVAERYSMHGDSWETDVTNTAGSLSVRAVRFWSPSSPRPRSMERLTYHRGAPWSEQPMTRLSGDPGVWAATSLPGAAWRMTDGGLGRPPRGALSGPPGTAPGPMMYAVRRDVFVRYWLLAVVFGTLPACYVAWRRRAARRRRAGLCLVCGYNLTGNVSGVCPECGTAVAYPPVATARR